VAIAARAFELSQRSGELTDILQTMALQADQWRAAGECDRSRTLGEQMLELAQRTGEPLHLALAHYTLGASLFFCGELSAGRVHLEQCVALWGAPRDRDLMEPFGMDVGVMALSWLTWSLWGLGYPEQALRCSQEALARGRASEHRFAVGLALTMACMSLAVLRGDVGAVCEHLATLAQVNIGPDNAFFQVWQNVFHGWLQTRQGEIEAGIATLRRAATIWEASGSRSGRPFQLTLLAEAYLRSGQIAAGLAAVAEGLAVVEQTGARLFEAELWRLRGELQIANCKLQVANRKSQNESTGTRNAEGEGRTLEDGESPAACFQQAIEIARRQGAKSWELRATVSLARLWQRQGRDGEAYQMLADVYGWFTEGFDTPDLQETRALLADLTP
jgi:predicted ATPase